MVARGTIPVRRIPGYVGFYGAVTPVDGITGGRVANRHHDGLVVGCGSPGGDKVVGVQVVGYRYQDSVGYGYLAVVYGEREEYRRVRMHLWRLKRGTRRCVIGYGYCRGGVVRPPVCQRVFLVKIGGSTRQGCSLALSNALRVASINSRMLVDGYVVKAVVVGAKGAGRRNVDGIVQFVRCYGQVQRTAGHVERTGIGAVPYAVDRVLAP